MVDTSAILTQNLPPIVNPLSTLSQVQGLQVQRQQLQNMQTQNASAQQQLSVARMNREAQAALGFIGSTDDPVEMEKKLRQHVADEVQSGEIDSNAAAVRNSQIPPAIQPDGTPTPITSYNMLLRQHAIANLSAQQAFDAASPAPHLQDFGDYKQYQNPPTQLNPNQQPTTVGPQMAPGLSPQTMQRYDPNAGGPGIGGMVNTTIGGKYGAPPPTPGAVLPGGQPQGGNPVPGNVPANQIPPAVGSVTPGRGGIPINGPMPPGSMTGPDGQPWPTTIPASGTPGGQPQMLVRTPKGNQLVPVQAPSAPQQSAQAGPNPFASAAPIGATESQGQNQQAYRNAGVAAAQLPLQNTQYQEAHDAIGRLQQSNLTTGAFQSALANARRVAVNLGVAGPETEKNMVDASTAEKYLTMAIASKNSNTDAGRELQGHANPTMQMPAGASLPIIRQIVAGNRAQQLIYDTAPDKTGNGFIDYQTKQSKLLNSKEGLAALSFDMMPQSQKQQYMTASGKPGPALSGPGAVDRFQQVLRLAHQDNLLNGNSQLESSPAIGPNINNVNPLAGQQNPLIRGQ